MINKVILLGNLGRDPECRDLSGDNVVANLSLATSDRYKNKDGKWIDTTEWHRISFFGKQAELCKTLKKGTQLLVEGSLKTRSYEDKSGAKKFVTEIRGDRIQIIGKPQTDAGLSEMNDNLPW